MSKDPVCGKPVEPSQAARHSQFLGREYDFCSPECQHQFDADPRRFVGIPCCGFGMGIVRRTIQRGSA